MNRLLQDKKSGWKLVKAESLKLRHTFGKILPAAAPFFTILLAFFLTGGGQGKALPIGAWNWWYTLLLPGMLAVLCYLGISKDKKIGDYHIWMQPEPVGKCLTGKIMYYVLALVTANFLFFDGVLLCGKLFGSTIGGWEGFCGFLLLSIASLWEIPLYMLLSFRFGMFATVFSCVALSLGGVVSVAAANLWWLCPSAVPSRLMCPVLGFLPNGLPVPEGSSLWNRNVILPGILISLSWFILLTGFVRCQFEKQSDRQRGGQSESQSGRRFDRQSVSAFGRRKNGR